MEWADAKNKDSYQRNVKVESGCWSWQSTQGLQSGIIMKMNPPPWDISHDASNPSSSSAEASV